MVYHRLCTSNDVCVNNTLSVCVCAYILGMPPIAQNKLEAEATSIRSKTLNLKEYYKLVHSYLHFHMYYLYICHAYCIKVLLNIEVIH